ncbi:branched-chain amino acid ABC transporter permease [Ensifer sp. ENS04]|uniref:branched-chain amino acid ABC transporter permease n=1 Tax=Ensifer sp. ENS04 TaxID=2769281 RepID=UPI0017854016|nr:branched-chain amino acid ABC transporter permease [Ensifer sp. ENS04]MBD9544766.1 branched-chain amino acid ABC transporter permease [Ensifer sp. ENS04]
MTSLSQKQRTGGLIAAVGLLTVLCVFVFTGTGFVDTLAFIGLLFTVFLASDQDRIDSRVGTFIIAFILLCVLPFIGLRNTFYLDVGIQVGIFAVLALGLNIVVGFAGLLDLGFIAFFAVGAYLWAILSSPHGGELLGAWFPMAGDSFFIIAIVAIFVAAGAGALLGLPVLRLKGDYLAIVTLGFGEVIRVLANNLDKPVNITNGPQGIPGIAQPLTEVAATLAQSGVPAFKWQTVIYYLIVLALVGIAIMANWRLDRSKVGRSWVAIREDEIAAQAMGVPLLKTKLIAFATGAAFAGVMGVVFSAKQTFVSPESFDFNQSIGVLAMIVLGGLGSIRGAIVGAALVTVLNLQVLKSLSTALNDLRASGFEILGWSFANLPSQFEPSKYERLIFGLILIAMMLLRPKGLVPSVRRTISASNVEGTTP